MADIEKKSAPSKTEQDGGSSVPSTPQLNRMTSIELMDEAALAACGYKQEFKR